MSCSEKEMEAVRGKVIGMIFQNPLDSLNPVYTVGNQVSEAIMLDRVDKQKAMGWAVRLFQDVKITDAQERVESFPHELSGGMCQRVMIAMMLPRLPGLLIANEPATALDVSAQAQILNLLLDLQEKMNLTYLVITRDLNVIRWISDKIAVVYLGKFVEFGPAEEVTERPKHPYTKGLMDAAPILDPPPGQGEGADEGRSGKSHQYWDRVQFFCQM